MVSSSHPHTHTSPGMCVVLYTDSRICFVYSRRAGARGAADSIGISSIALTLCLGKCMMQDLAGTIRYK